MFLSPSDMVHYGGPKHAPLGKFEIQVLEIYNLA